MSSYTAPAGFSSMIPALRACASVAVSGDSAGVLVIFGDGDVVLLFGNCRHPLTMAMATKETRIMVSSLSNCLSVRLVFILSTSYALFSILPVLAAAFRSQRLGTHGF